MHEQTRRLIMWAEHADRWEPIGTIAPKQKRRIGFLFTANLPKNTTTVQVDATAYKTETETERTKK